MLLIVFFALLATCLGSWAAGVSFWIVFGAALATWIVFYFVLYPKVRTYKIAMGIDDKLKSYEAEGWELIGLHLAGFKVMVLGFLTSTVPFLADAAQWLNGQKLDFFFDPSKPERQQLVTFVIGAVIFLVPFLSSWLHSHALAKAAETTPKA